MADLKPFIAKAANGTPLTLSEAREAFNVMMSGEATPSQIGGLLKLPGRTSLNLFGLGLDALDGFSDGGGEFELLPRNVDLDFAWLGLFRGFFGRLRVAFRLLDFLGCFGLGFALFCRLFGRPALEQFVCGLLLSKPLDCRLRSIRLNFHLVTSRSGLDSI